MRFKRFFNVFLLVSIFGGFCSLFGQVQKIDSLNLLLSQAQTDSTRIELLYRIGSAYVDVDNDSSIVYFKKTISLGASIPYPLYEYSTLRSLGHAYIWKKDQFQLGLKCLNRAYELASVEKDTLEQARILSQIGCGYHKKGQRGEALKYFLWETELSEKTNRPLVSCIANINMGLMLAESEECEKANGYYSKALEFAKEAKSVTYEALILNNIASIYLEKKEYETASQYLTEAEMLILEEENYQILFLINISKGEISVKQGDPIKGISFFEKAREYNKLIGSKENEALVLFYLANAFKKNGQNHKSTEVAEKALKIYDDIGLVSNHEELYFIIAENYDLIGNYSKAMEYYKELSGLYRKEEKTKETKEIAKLQLDYEIKKKDNDILQLQNKDLQNEKALIKAKSKEQLLVFGLVTIFLCFLLFFFINKSWELRRLNRLKNTLSDDLHDNIGASLNHIKMLANQLNQKQFSEEKREGILFKIKNISNELMYNMHDLVWALRKEHETVGDMIVKFQDYADNTLSDFNVPYQFEVNEIDEKRKLSTKEKINIYAIFKESINNALKHTESEKVNISFEKDTERNFRLCVQNYYKAKRKVKSVSSQNGIPNMKKRAKEIRGRLQTINDIDHFSLIFSW